MGRRGERGSRGGGEGGRKRGGTLVPRIPNPKLIPERDGSGGVSWDADLRFEVPGACRLLCFALEAFIFVLGRTIIYRFGVPPGPRSRRGGGRIWRGG